MNGGRGVRSLRRQGQGEVDGGDEIMLNVICICVLMNVRERHRVRMLDKRRGGMDPNKE